MKQQRKNIYKPIDYGINVHTMKDVDDYDDFHIGKKRIGELWRKHIQGKP